MSHDIVETRDAAVLKARELGYPVRLIPSFVVGDYSRVANNDEEVGKAARTLLAASPTGRLKVEKVGGPESEPIVIETTRANSIGEVNQGIEKLLRRYGDIRILIDVIDGNEAREDAAPYLIDLGEKAEFDEGHVLEILASYPHRGAILIPLF